MAKVTMDPPQVRVWGLRVRDLAPDFQDAVNKVAEAGHFCGHGYLAGYAVAAVMPRFVATWTDVLGTFGPTMIGLGDKFTASANAVAAADQQSGREVRSSGNGFATVDVRIDGTTWANGGT